MEAIRKFEAYIVHSFYFDQVERTPVEVSRGNRFFKDGWSAFFRYKRQGKNYTRARGRLVYMDDYGENLQEEHLDVYRVPQQRRSK